MHKVYKAALVIKARAHYTQYLLYSQVQAAEAREEQGDIGTFAKQFELIAFLSCSQDCIRG